MGLFEFERPLQPAGRRVGAANFISLSPRGEGGNGRKAAVEGWGGAGKRKAQYRRRLRTLPSSPSAWWSSR